MTPNVNVAVEFFVILPIIRYDFCNFSSPYKNPYPWKRSLYGITPAMGIQSLEFLY